MTIDIRFPEPPATPASVDLHRPVDPEWSPDRILELAKAHRIDAEPVDAGLWHLVRDERAALEIYQASHSVRFALRGDASERLEPAAVDDGTAIELALDWMRRLGEVPVVPDGIRVSSEEVLISERPESEPRVIEVGRQVNIALGIDGIPLVGPGGKAQVTIGAGDEITSAYRFWRDTARVGERRVEPAEAIMDRFRRAPLFDGVRGGSAEVTGIRLGYFAEPPTEIQRWMVPTYELTGELRVEGAEPYRFIQYAPAVRMPTEKPRPRRRPAPVG